jgi:hypothetical protein
MPPHLRKKENSTFDGRGRKVESVETIEADRERGKDLRR